VEKYFEIHFDLILDASPAAESLFVLRKVESHASKGPPVLVSRSQNSTTARSRN